MDLTVLSQAAAAYKDALARKTNISFELGDIALAYVGLPGPVGRHNPEAQRLHELAQAVERAPESIRKYLSVSVAWPPGTRIPGASWSACCALKGTKDRFEMLAENPGMTVDEAKLRAKGKPRKQQGQVIPLAHTSPSLRKALTALRALKSDDVDAFLHLAEQEKLLDREAPGILIELETQIANMSVELLPEVWDTLGSLRALINDRLPDDMKLA